MTTTQDTIYSLLSATRTVAVVGYSSNESRAGHYVPAYLHDQGYTIIPVNPFVEGAAGSLADVDADIDLMLVFRKPEAVPGVVQEAIDAGAKAVWLQSGIRHDSAAAKARDAGLDVVQDRCMMVEHGKWMRAGKPCA